MEMNQIAKDRIDELESLIEDLYVIIDLKYEDCNDLQEQVKMLKAQVVALMKGQRVDYQVG